MTENELATMAVNSAFHIHSQLGPGLLESVYQKIMAHELRSGQTTGIWILLVRHKICASA